MSIPPQFEGPLLEVTQPSRAECTHAKAVILELLSSGVPMRTHDLLNQVRNRCLGGIPTPPTGDQIDLPRDGDPSILQPDRPAFAYQRWFAAAVEGLAELEANGVVLPAMTASQIHLSLKSGNTSWSATVGPPGPAVSADAYVLPEQHRLTDNFLLDAALYAQGIEPILGDRGLRCLEEATNAHRRGLQLAAVGMLGAASEAAWYGIGERLAGATGSLRTALDAENTLRVISLGADGLRAHGVPNGVCQEIQVQAVYLRDLRNYGLHPRGATAAQLEHHFTDEAAGLIFLQGHRYFGRLAEAASAIP
jgi:hypothetical protein